jgi:hypothetical protein
MLAMLNYNYVPPQAAPRRVAAQVILSPRVRGACPHDWPALRTLLLNSGLSLTGLSDRFDTLLVLEQHGRPGGSGEILGAVAVEPGRLALIRSLVLLADGSAPRYETLLLGCALQLAGTLGAEETVLIVETPTQIPSQHGGVIFWETLRQSRPDSALVRELSRLDSTALAVRLALPKVAGSCAIR